jgi:4-hydroxy-4-methyl-2-oxoglutarate aldolase
MEKTDASKRTARPVSRSARGDVRDGMDTRLHHWSGSMEPSIRPLFRTRAFGIARTCRYLPFRGSIPALPPEAYWEWANRYYAEVCSYPWVADIQEGDFIVIDQSGVNAGLMGSANTLDCLERGARGFVTNGGMRDTDEIILQGIPYWSPICSQAMVQGRLEFDGKDIPLCVGGVQVKPGDLVVADGDGVIAVPQEIAEEAARYAIFILSWRLSFPLRSQREDSFYFSTWKNLANPTSWSKKRRLPRRCRKACGQLSR